MYVLKGFISNSLFTSNIPGTVSVLGELSTYSSTFSRERGLYTNQTAAPNLILSTLLSKNDTASIPAPSLILEQILEISSYVYSQSEEELTALELLENLLVNYVGDAENFQSGTIITDNVHTLPEWISWKSKVDVGHSDNFIKIWFCDNSFRQQYDEYEIVVVPPIISLNNFFQNGAYVDNLVNLMTSVETTDRVQAAKGNHPETILRTNTYMYFDPANQTHQVKTDWNLLIYGPAGDNIDSIKDALQAYILANSTHTREEWIAIIPDIFKRTEFILVPLWNQYAIPNRELQQGIYSPQVSLAEALTLVKEYATQYPTPHIDSHVTVMGYTFKSMAILVIGSNDNRNGDYRLTDVFPDLIMVTSTSPDFNRMSQDTQNWASMLASMIVTAETMGDFTTVPAGMMKTRRDDILYLTKSFKNINYLVVAKKNFPEDDEEPIVEGGSGFEGF